MDIYEHEVTALIGPSGCGKTTFLRCLNRMNDLIPGDPDRRADRLRGEDLYGAGVAAHRGPPPHRHGLPEAQPVSRSRSTTTWPSAPGSTASSARHGRPGRGSPCAGPPCGTRSRTSSSRAPSPCRAASSSGSASPGPSPSSPRSSSWTSPARPSTRSPRSAIEELMTELKSDYTIVVVTHNMQQAARVVRPDGLLHRRGHADGPGPGCWSRWPRPGHLHQSRPISARTTTSPARPADRLDAEPTSAGGGWPRAAAGGQVRRVGRRVAPGRRRAAGGRGASAPRWGPHRCRAR